MMLTQPGKRIQIKGACHPINLNPEMEAKYKLNLVIGNKIKKQNAQITERILRRNTVRQNKFTTFSFDQTRQDNYDQSHQSSTQIKFKKYEKLSSYQLYKSQQKSRSEHINRVHILRRKHFTKKLDQKSRKKLILQCESEKILKEENWEHRNSHVFAIDGNIIKPVSLFDSPREHAKSTDKYIKTAEGKRKKIDPLTLLKKLISSNRTVSSDFFMTTDHSCHTITPIIPFTKSITPLKSHTFQDVSTAKRLYRAHKAMKKHQILQNNSMQKSAYRPWSPPKHEIILEQDITSIYDKIQANAEIQ